MVIVAGHITVEPQQRESYLTGWVSIQLRPCPSADIRKARVSEPPARTIAPFRSRVGRDRAAGSPAP